MADKASTQVESTRRGLSAIASGRKFQGNNPRQQTALVLKLLDTYPDISEAVLYDKKGKGLVRASRSGTKIFWGPAHASREGHDEFEIASRGNTFIGPLFFSSKDKIPTMILSVPTGDHGVLRARLELGTLWKMIQEPPQGDVVSFMADGKGRILDRPETTKETSFKDGKQNPLIQAFLKSKNDGFLVAFWKGDKKNLGVFHRVSGLDWAIFVEIPYGSVLAPIRWLGLKILAMATGLGVLFGVLGFSFINRLLRPLGALQEGLEHLGRGELSHRTQVKTGDEFERVAEALNRAAQSLQSGEQTRKDLSNMIVHDLKSPLTATLGSIDFVLHLAKETLTPEQKKLLSVGSKSGKELLRLIQNLLDLSKMEEGKLVLQPETFSIVELTGNCLDDLETQIARENKGISVDVQKDLPPAWADRDLVHRVLANLLSNALKHTPAQTNIGVFLRRTPDNRRLEVVVKDNGLGIPLEHQKMIFDKFSQAEIRKQKHRVGSGLGLTFCKLAVEAHGGVIQVKSTPGQGSEFSFTLPTEKNTNF